MSLTVELPEELAERLKEVASRRGIEPEEYALRLIEQQLPTGRSAPDQTWQTLGPEEWIRRTREWAESHRDWPVLPPEAFERESFYGDRG